MFARATSGDKRNNNRFSSCSLNAINPVLNTKARSPKGCFTGEYRAQPPPSIQPGAVCARRSRRMAPIVIPSFISANIPRAASMSLLHYLPPALSSATTATFALVC